MKCKCQCHPVEISGFSHQYKPGDRKKMTVCNHCLADEQFAHSVKKVAKREKKWWEFWKD